jgi:hypothetical protein
VLLGSPTESWPRSWLVFVEPYLSACGFQGTLHPLLWLYGTVSTILMGVAVENCQEQACGSVMAEGIPSSAPLLSSIVNRRDRKAPGA